MRARVELGLVVHRELPIERRVGQCALDLQHTVGRRVQPRLVEAVGVAGALLAIEHGSVGVLEQRIGGRTVVRVDHHADAGRCAHAPAVDFHRFTQAEQQLVADGGGGFGQRQAFDQDAEFIAAEPCDDVFAPHGLAQALCDDLKDAVAGAAAVLFVDVAEVVEIQVEQRERPPAPGGRQDRGVQRVTQIQPVGQARECIVMLRCGRLARHACKRGRKMCLRGIDAGLQHDERRMKAQRQQYAAGADHDDRHGMRHRLVWGPGRRRPRRQRHHGGGGQYGRRLRAQPHCPRRRDGGP